MTIKEQEMESLKITPINNEEYTITNTDELVEYVSKVMQMVTPVDNTIDIESTMTRMLSDTIITRIAGCELYKRYKDKLLDPSVAFIRVSILLTKLEKTLYMSLGVVVDPDNSANRILICGPIYDN